MRLSDFKPGTSVTLVARRNELHFEADTRIVSRDTQSVLVEPVIVDGKIINFNGNVTVSARVYDLLSDRVCEFAVKRIQTVTTDGYGKLYCIYSGELSVDSNRRKAERVSCEFPASVKVARFPYVDNCVVTDLSRTGVGLLVPRRLARADIGSHVRMQLQSPLKREPYYETAKLVRTAESFSSDKILLGCEFYNEQIPISILVDMIKGVPMRPSY